MELGCVHLELIDESIGIYNVYYCESQLTEMNFYESFLTVTNRY